MLFFVSLRGGDTAENTEQISRDGECEPDDKGYFHFFISFLLTNFCDWGDVPMVQANHFSIIEMYPRNHFTFSIKNVPSLFFNFVVWVVKFAPIMRGFTRTDFCLIGVNQADKRIGEKGDDFFSDTLPFTHFHFFISFLFFLYYTIFFPNCQVLFFQKIQNNQTEGNGEETTVFDLVRRGAFHCESAIYANEIGDKVKSLSCDVVTADNDLRDKAQSEREVKQISNNVFFHILFSFHLVSVLQHTSVYLSSTFWEKIKNFF